jgi:eukaryotic-like serine/threonine-protein kinase
MDAFRNLVREVHRRSLWQVLGIYLMGSWGALQVVDGVTDNAGLPDWVPPFALVLLVIGLPIVLATAVVQEGLPGREGGADSDGSSPEGAADEGAGRSATAGTPGGADVAAPPTEGVSPAHRMFTWRNAIAGGVAAFSLLGVAVVVYFGMRAAGVGPVASLAAQGIFDDREPVVLAEFAGSATEPALARLVGEALRVDLVESTALTVVPESYISEAMGRMELPADASLTPQVAREIALRDGFKAVIAGEVGALGGGFVLTASLIEARSGEPLAAFRETVADEAGLLAAIDKLSERIREKAGESLRQIRAGESLESVTTSSLDALKLYSEAQAMAERGRETEALALLESALEIDPEFGMAWRKLAVLLGNTGSDPARRREASTKAYELRERMTEIERFLAEAYYFAYVDVEEQRAIQAYERVLAVAPDESTALNNLALLLQSTDRDRTVGLLERSVNGPGATSVAHTNLVQEYWNRGRDDEARALIERTQERYPGSERGHWLSLDLESLQGGFAAAHDGRRERLVSGSVTSRVRLQQEIQLAMEDAGMGRLEEGRGHVGAALGVAAAAEQPSWAVDALMAWAYVEALLGTPDGARRYLRLAAAEGPVSELDADGWNTAFAVTGRALIGDVAEARQWLAGWEAAIPPPQRRELMRAAMAWGRWGVAMAEGDTDAALASLDYIQNEFERCGDLRCWGWWDRGRALEAGGRGDEARAMYRRHLEGLAVTETRWNPVQTVDALWRLGGLAESAGDAAEAASAYGRFAELLADADPPLQARVRMAREKSAALGG